MRHRGSRNSTAKTTESPPPNSAGFLFAAQQAAVLGCSAGGFFEAADQFVVAHFSVPIKEKEPKANT
jgi:hypothetical protein